MRTYIIVALAVLMSVLAAACGGDGNKPIVLQPDPIPDEYQGMSMEELRSNSSAKEYSDIIGTTAGEVYKGGNDPEISENILKHKGTLLYYRGVIEQVFPSSQEGIFTFWFCSSSESETFSYKTSNDCVDPLFLLYNLDMGPELARGDEVEIAGILVNSRIKKGSTVSGDRNIAGGLATIFIAPSVSVIKAELVK